MTDLSPAEVIPEMNTMMNKESKDQRRCRVVNGVRIYDNPNDDAAIIHTDGVITTYLRYKHRWYYAEILEGLVR